MLGLLSDLGPYSYIGNKSLSHRSKTEESHTFNTNADLSEATIQSLSQEEKEQIVEQWVRQTSTQEARDELEQFAYEIAESVVSTMERNSNTQVIMIKVIYKIGSFLTTNRIL